MLNRDIQSLYLPAVLPVLDWAWPQQHDYTPLANYAKSPNPPQDLWFHLKLTDEQQQDAKRRFPTRHVALSTTWALLADRLLSITGGPATGLVCPTGTVWPAAGIAQLLVLGLDASALVLVGRRRRRESYQHDEKLAPESSGGCLSVSGMIWRGCMSF